MRVILVFTVFLIFLVGCVPEFDRSSDGGKRSRSPLPSSTPELEKEFQKQSGIKIPANAKNMKIEAELQEGVHPYFEMRFATTRGGAELFCESGDLEPLRQEGGPDQEDRETFSVKEDDESIYESVLCEGSSSENPDVMQQALVVFQEDGMKKKDESRDGEDLAIVYAYSSEMPSEGP